jgi:glutamate-1-semialdehyde 2,1-aminomutase
MYGRGENWLMTKSEQLFEEAVKYIPGGVNSPVRAYGSVGLTPRFITKAEGAYIEDADGNKYIDYIGSWGPMILGSNNEQVFQSVVEACRNGLSFGAATEMEVKMAKLICEIVPSIEMVRMVNSGTEAVMSAIRVARGFTGRNKIIKFAGCYHGHSDAMLVKAGSGVMTAGVPDSAGVPNGCTEDTLTAIYNDFSSVEELFSRFGKEIAAVIIEPVAANMGVVLPENGFLEKLRKICDENQTLLIFDEVITGFRLGIDGAQGYFGIKPDLTTFGKIIGGGMPVGAYGGRKEIMEMIAPIGGVYQAGTLSGNPVAMAAGYTQLSILKDNPAIYTNLNQKANQLFEGMRQIIEESKMICTLNHVGSLGCMFFTKNQVHDYSSAKTSDTKVFCEYFQYMLNHGIYIAPSQFEAMFVSAAIGDKEIKETLSIIKKYFQNRMK